MKKFTILKAFALLAVSAMAFGCAQKEFEEIKEVSLARCLQPQNLSMKVDPTTGDYVTFGWDVNKDAQAFNLIIATDADFSSVEKDIQVLPTEVPYTIRLTADKEYWFKVCSYKLEEASEESGIALPIESTISHWAIYDGSEKTYAVKDNLFLEVTGRTANSVTFAWSDEASDYKEVTMITASPVKGGSKVTYELNSADIDSASATVDGLEASTEYQFVLFYMSASRGAVDTWTMAEAGSKTVITNSEELKSAVALGGDLYLSYSETPYSMGTAKPAASLTVTGELSADGLRPVVNGIIDLSAAIADGSSIRFENVSFLDDASNSHLITFTDDANAHSLDKIEIVNCEIAGYKCGLFSINKKGGLTVNAITFDSCDIYNILGSGGDGFDVRQACDLKYITFYNNTIYDGFRTLFRLDQVEAIKVGTVDFQNNTVKNIATMNDGNNRALFSFYVPVNLILKKNVFLHENGGVTDEATVDKAQLIHDNSKTVDPTITADANFSYAHGKDFFKRASAATLSCKELNEDPCYNSKGNFFNLTNDDVVKAKAGAAKWLVAYVEKEEDLTQNFIEGAHVWNLQDASLFAGEVKNSRVRDDLMLVGTNTTPMNADGAINFLSASATNRKGVPTEGYLTFKVKTAGSVDMLLADGGSSSVVVAVLDDNGFNVIGGAMATSNAGVQKVVIPSVSGDATVYLYSTGAISLQKLAWSLDVLAGNKVLSTPTLTVDPVTLTEGDETEVKVSWSEIPNAAYYELKFNKRAVELEDGALEYTVPAETIAALDAGMYYFTIVAHPAADDIYYQKSQTGTGSVAVQPKGGDPVVEKTITWDFTAEYSANFDASGTDTYKYEAGAIEVVTSSDATETLYFAPNGKNIKTAGKTCTADGIDYKPITYSGGAAYAFFNTAKAGKLKITATQGKLASDGKDCTIGIKVDGVSMTDLDAALDAYDPAVAVLGAKVFEWDITNATGAAQQIQIVKVSGSTSPWIYKIEFTYSEAAPAGVTYKWNFTEEYSANFDASGTDTYKYEAGAIEVVTSSDATETLYFAPNGKNIKTAGKTCTADGIDYKPITYSGGAAYAFIKTAKAGKLKIIATQGKLASDGKDCTIGIKIDGVSQTDLDAVLDAYDPAVAGLGAKEFEWDITNASGAVQEIQIVKVTGSTSPWIYQIVFEAK